MWAWVKVKIAVFVRFGEQNRVRAIFRVSLTFSKLFDIFFWLIITYSDPCKGVCRLTPPNFTTTHFPSQKVLPYTIPPLLSYCGGGGG